MIKDLNLGELTSQTENGINSAQDQAQLKFMETLKFRIDSRVVKILKHKKKLPLTELVEQVIHDLQMQLHLPQNEEQLAKRKDTILSRINDLESRFYIKQETDIVEYLPV